LQNVVEITVPPAAAPAARARMVDNHTGGNLMDTAGESQTANLLSTCLLRVGPRILRASFLNIEGFQ